MPLICLLCKSRVSKVENVPVLVNFVSNLHRAQREAEQNPDLLYRMVYINQLVLMQNSCCYTVFHNSLPGC